MRIRRLRRERGVSLAERQRFDYATLRRDTGELEAAAVPERAPAAVALVAESEA